MLANKALSSAPSAEPVFVESVFSTYLYTGNGSTQTITNNIDLAGKGGLVWIKARTSSVARSHRLFDTERGVLNFLETNTTAAQAVNSLSLQSFNSNGFGLGSNGVVNGSDGTFASWTFRKQAKFFDVVTYTGNGSNRTIAHNLGSVPGCIIVKRTDTTADWQVYHRSLANTEYMVLNSTAAKATGTTRWNSTTPTSTVFSLGTDTTVNASGGTYVAYLFAHDAGGFGLTGTDNVISCGSVSVGTTGSVTTDLGYEPQFVIVKQSSSAVDSWHTFDNMRGFFVDSTSRVLYPEDSFQESDANFCYITNKGFKINARGGIARDYIYIAIRRGPMKTPTSGTSVFSPVARTGTGTVTSVSTGFAPDAVIVQTRSHAVGDAIYDKLRGTSAYLTSSSADAEYSASGEINSFNNDGFTLGTNPSLQVTNVNTRTYINWALQRAPGFFDVVCYTGNDAINRTITHNLGVAPELMIIKGRSSSITGWVIYAAPRGAGKSLFLNTDAAEFSVSTYFDSTAPTSSVFTVGGAGATNGNGTTFVNYLFATCPGVSKVGSYTGTGTTNQIDCGFTGGARFVLIKRTDSTGDWYVWDSARGIVAGNDPYLLLNSTAAEVTNTDYIDTYSAGFEISSTAPAAINANGGTFIFLAVA